VSGLTSVPPSTMGRLLPGVTDPSSSYSMKLQIMSLIHLLASNESRPSTMIWNDCHIKVASYYQRALSFCAQWS
jgi:hypothetical protein